MAWSEKLPSGKYRGVYRDAAGKRRSVGTTFSHKSKAERAAAAAEETARRRLRGSLDDARTPWDKWADEKWLPARSVASATAKGDKHRLENHLRPKWAGVPIGTITRHDVKTWVGEMKRAGLGPESIRRAVHLFSASMVDAMEAEIIEYNPAARLKLAKGAEAQERYLTHAEADEIRDRMPTVRDVLIFDTLINTGLRWGEMAGIHVPRVDLERGSLRVVETWDETDGRIKAYPKGRRERSVPLIDDLVARYADLPHEGRTCGVEHQTGRCVGPLLLMASGGTPLRNSNWASRVWRPAVELAGFPEVRIHDCRHTYASWLINRGLSLAEVGKLLGHVSPQTTQRYAHLVEMSGDRVRFALAAPDLPHAG